MIAEPYKLKTIRNIEYSSLQKRIDALMEAGYNTFNIPSFLVTFDMTSQGTSAVSQEQFAGLFIGDETYAGSRNFENLCAVVKEMFGHDNVCPTHNLKGSHKLIIATMVNDSDYIFGNSLNPSELIYDRNANIDLIIEKNDKFSGNIDATLLETALKNNKNVPFVYIELFANGYNPVSLKNIKEVAQIAKNNGTVLVVNGSYIVSNADYIRKNEEGYSNKTLKEIIKEIGENSHIFVIDAGQDPRSNTGGLISTNIYELYDKYMNEVVVYEGLHTYGGMAGRTMEVFARGLSEMVYEKQAAWILFQIEKFAAQLKNIPFYKGADGIYIKADEFLPNCENPAHTLAAAIYLKSGVRCFLDGRFDTTILPVQIPRMAFTNEQLDEIAEVINQIYGMRNKITGLSLENEPSWNDEAFFKWKRPVMDEYFFKSEPFTLQQIEYVGETTEAERLEHAIEAGFNTFLLQSKHVAIDFLTDSGTTAQTTTQWAKYIESCETQATTESYFDFVETLQEVTGYKFIIPTHQGRAAEHIMSQCLISGGIVPGNMYFTTTKLHQEMAGGTFADVICDEAHDPTNKFRWKGNIDLNKVKKLVEEHGAENIPYISFEFKR
jgi:tryptophanase